MDSITLPEHHKVVVLGAGINGISIAKTYLDIDPSVDILLVDCESSVGGVWSRERIYPGLHYEVPTPFLNFSEFDMCEEFDMEKWSDVTGYQVNEFLAQYATKFDIIRRCRFNTMAQKIERNGAGWKVFVRPTINSWTADKHAPVQELTCDKLVLATGITSVPSMPKFDLSSFDGFSFHSVEMGRRYAELTADSVNHVTIVGGHKSALEAVGTCAQAGKKVEWLMRADGGGPTWLMPAKNPDGSAFAKFSTIRVMSFLSSSVYASHLWINRFLHSGRWWLGTWLFNLFWAFMTKMVHGDKYSKSENGRRLKPQPDSMFWFVPGGTITHDRDLETLRLVDEEKLIRVNRAHLVSAKGRSIALDTGETVETDAIIWCTGWQLANFTLCTPDLANELGLPVLLNKLPEKEKKYFEALDSEAENRMLDLYPILKSPPTNLKRHDFGISSFRLFRFFIPPKLAARGDNSLVVIGNYANGRVQTTAEIVTLFAVAYLEDILPPHTKALLLDFDAMNKDIAHVDAHRRKRYLNFAPYRLSIFESSEFDDQLMNDLGLRADRKRLRTPGGWRGWFGLKAWYREWFEGYFASDYKGIVQEFMAGVEERRGQMNGFANSPIPTYPDGKHAVNGLKED